MASNRGGSSSRAASRQTPRAGIGSAGHPPLAQPPRPPGFHGCSVGGCPLASLPRSRLRIPHEDPLRTPARVHDRRARGGHVFTPHPGRRASCDPRADGSADRCGVAGEARPSARWRGSRAGTCDRPSGRGRSSGLCPSPGRCDRRCRRGARSRRPAACVCGVRRRGRRGAVDQARCDRFRVPAAGRRRRGPRRELQRAARWLRAADEGVPRDGGRCPLGSDRAARRRCLLAASCWNATGGGRAGWCR